MAANVSKPDAAFGNEPPGEPELGPEYGGGFLQCQEPLDSQTSGSRRS